MLCAAAEGEVPERSNGAVSKTVVPSRAPRVRIPVSPPAVPRLPPRLTGNSKRPNARRWRQAMEQRDAAIVFGPDSAHNFMRICRLACELAFAPAGQNELDHGQGRRAKPHMQLRWHHLSGNGKSRVECRTREGMARAHAQPKFMRSIGR